MARCNPWSRLRLADDGYGIQSVSQLAQGFGVDMYRVSPWGFWVLGALSAVVWIDVLRRTSMACGLLVGTGQLAFGQDGTATDPEVTTVVCASEDGAQIVDGSAIIAVHLAREADGWLIVGDFVGTDVMVKDRKRFTVIGPNYLITVYHSRGALVGVDETIPLICKEIRAD